MLKNKFIFICGLLSFFINVNNAYSQQIQENQVVNTIQSNQNKDNIILNIPNKKYDKLKAQLEYCGMESNSAIRLACYENYISESGIKIYHVVKSNNLWVKNNDSAHKDWLVTVQSNNVGKSGNKTSLTIRCNNGSMSLYLKYGTPIGNKDISVNFGLSPENMGSYRFSPSKSEDALGIWNNNNAIYMSKFIAEHPITLYVKTNFTDGNQLDTFLLDGSDTALVDVRRACNW